jgi:hypothetical protein
MGEHGPFVILMIFILVTAFTLVSLTPLWSKPPVPRNPKADTESSG